MSRAFVKDDDQVDELPDRPISGHPNYVTSAGLASIAEELESARQAFASARATADRSSLATAARDLRYWSARRASAQVVPPAVNDTVVQFGSFVTILREGGRRQSFRIVGEDEANPDEGSISYLSPLAKSLIGCARGDTIRAGREDAEIVAIET